MHNTLLLDYRDNRRCMLEERGRKRGRGKSSFTIIFNVNSCSILKQALNYFLPTKTYHMIHRRQSLVVILQHNETNTLIPRGIYNELAVARKIPQVCI